MVSVCDCDHALIHADTAVVDKREGSVTLMGEGGKNNTPVVKSRATTLPMGREVGSLECQGCQS